MKLGLGWARREGVLSTTMGTRGVCPGRRRVHAALIRGNIVVGVRIAAVVLIERGLYGAEKNGARNRKTGEKTDCAISLAMTGRKTALDVNVITRRDESQTRSEVVF